MDANIIQSLQKPSNLNRDWIIDRAQCLILIDELNRKARKARPPSDVVSMAGIQRQGYSIVQLFLVMLSGKVEYGVSFEKARPTSLKHFIDFKIIENSIES
ncbi:MAG: hypothetical protein ACJAVN_001817 [Roseivirga sp.]